MIGGRWYDTVIAFFVGEPRWRGVLMVLPALLLVGVLLCAGLGYAVAQSLGLVALTGAEQPGLDAYRALLDPATLAGSEVGPALLLSLGVSVASTAISAGGALLLVALAAGRRSRVPLLPLYLSLSVPHLVWAVALALLLGQSGLLARAAAAAGLIDAPAQFPVLVRDRHGLGIVLDYVSKELPFLTLLGLSALRAQPEGYDDVAANLGAGWWQRLRWVTLPAVGPALLSGALLVFAFVLAAYEVPAVLGVRYPRALPVLALAFFLNPDLNSRAAGMALSLLLTGAALALALVALLLRRRRAQ